MYDLTKPHHTAEGFRNNYPTSPRGSFWKWQWERWRKGLPPRSDGTRFAQVKPDVSWLKTNRKEGSLTWVGHATFLLQLGGQNLLTDAHLSARASPFAFAGPQRQVAPALEFHDLPHIDAVIISHNHYDHLDLTTVKRLSRQSGGSARFFVPLGLKAWFVGHGMHDVVELDWWECAHHAGLDLYLVPVQHWSARTSFDVNRTLWGGWIVDLPRAIDTAGGEAPPARSQPAFRFFFAGDTGYSRDFQDIAQRFASIDLAALPIGAYEPRWFMQVMHVNPEEAVKIHRDLQARRSVAMHWGTFVLSDEPLAEPPHRLAAARRAAGISEEEFFLMKHGETRRLTPFMSRALRDVAANAPA